MATPSLLRPPQLSSIQVAFLPRQVGRLRNLQPHPCPLCRQHCLVPRRHLSSSARRQSNGDSTSNHRASFASRLRIAFKNTKIQWSPIPVGLGIGFLGFAQLYRIRQREARRREEEAEEQEELQYGVTEGGQGGDNGERPKKRKRIRPSGPWTVQLMSWLPLKGMSRVWGWFNELQIPYYLRVPGFRLYSWIFGVNLSEVSEPDLHVYPNLASFFYRTLKPGVRPLALNSSALLSPADGRVLTFGVIEHGEVEQIKGMTYSLEALLGSASPTLEGAPDEISHSHKKVERDASAGDAIRADEEFANVNGISYTLPSALASKRHQQSSAGPAKTTPHDSVDQSIKSKSSSIAEVRADLALTQKDSPRWFFPSSAPPKVPTALYYVVIYLAPGDYHRFHSPAAWVVEKRRHFAGELYSVSPYLQRTLPGLFTLNERVVLLGRWRWGFFSFTPVGATNVGSIRVNFDRELRTNSLTTDTAADRAAEEAAARGEPYCGFAEAIYANASSVLGGHALRRGEEMGGFQLGSSIVLVFEAPKGQRASFDEGWSGERPRKGGWHWSIQKGQKVKFGEELGAVDEPLS